MLTGDKEGTAKAIGRACGIAEEGQDYKVYGGKSAPSFDTNRATKNKVADVEMVGSINIDATGDEKVNVEGG
jgi:magnesium-transporting ATPase (P-type)